MDSTLSVGADARTSPLALSGSLRPRVEEEQEQEHRHLELLPPSHGSDFSPREDRQSDLDPLAGTKRPHPPSRLDDTHSVLQPSEIIDLTAGDVTIAAPVDLITPEAVHPSLLDQQPTFLGRAEGDVLCLSPDVTPLDDDDVVADDVDQPPAKSAQRPLVEKPDADEVLQPPRKKAKMVDAGKEISDRAELPPRGPHPPVKKVKIADLVNDFEDGEEVVPKSPESRQGVYEMLPGSPLPDVSLADSVTANSEEECPREYSAACVNPADRRAKGLIPPAIAPRLPAPDGVADFHPWSRSGPEDDLDESVIKGGYFDKAPDADAGETDTGSARTIVCESLSQNNVAPLQMLSYLYTQVLEKREELGLLTGATTFKPPPRVTVTDTKREAWLRDLANPRVPLRKQSRTIPHGIRGKILLDQCVGKTVPIARALWLVKCVGANELRALKRKGVGLAQATVNETKWLHEWTLGVELFLEDIISTCGQHMWFEKIGYSLRLTATIYSQKLLNESQFLSWVIGSFARASLDWVPCWMLVVRVFWGPIMTYAKRGRRLAEAALEHLEAISERGKPACTELSVRLAKIVSDVTETKGIVCLLLPGSWTRYKRLLRTKTSRITGGILSDITAAAVARRNDRLTAMTRKTASSMRSVIIDLYAGLDSVGLNVDLDRILARCENLVPDLERLIAALLDWAASPFRTGDARIYIVAGLIAKLHDTGYDTQATLLRYLGGLYEGHQNTRTQNLQRVVVDLVHLKAFSIAKYLQWVISSGCLSRDEGLTCATKLIFALSDRESNSATKNTRRMLMGRLGYGGVFDRELKELNSHVKRTTQAFADADIAGMDLDELRIPTTWSLASKFEFATRTSEILIKITKESSSGLTVASFMLARAILESVSDIRSLTDLIMLATTSDSIPLLTTTVDTINLHSLSLAASGSLKPLLSILATRYAAVRAKQPLNRTFILALHSLVTRFPSEKETSAPAKALLADLMVCEQRQSLVVCSPASDNLVSMQAHGKLESDKEIDAVFASGNTMDEALMRRMFDRIALRVAKVGIPTTSMKRNGQGEVGRVSEWFNRLRAVDPKAFDELVKARFVAYFSDFSRETPDLDGTGCHLSPAAIVILVASGCASLAVFAEVGKERLLSDQPENASLSLHAATDSFLSLFACRDASGFGLSETEKYHFRVQQELCFAGHVDAVRLLLRKACGVSGFAAQAPHLRELILRCFGSDNGTDSAPTRRRHTQRWRKAPILRSVPLFDDWVAGPADNNGANTDSTTMYEEDAKSSDNAKIITEQNIISLVSTVLKWEGDIGDGSSDSSLPDARVEQGKEPKSSPIITDLDAATAIRMADALSVRFCVALVACLDASIGGKCEDGNQVQIDGTEEDDEASKVTDAIIDVLRSRSEVWPQLLDVASHKAKTRIRAWALEQLFSSFDLAEGETGRMEHSSMVEEPKQEQRTGHYLDVLAIATSKTTNFASSIDTNAATLLTLADRLKEVDKQLTDLKTEMSPEESTLRLRRTLANLHTLLQLCGLYTYVHIGPSTAKSTDTTVGGAGNDTPSAAPPETPKQPNDLKFGNESTKHVQQRCAVLSALCDLIVHPRLQLQSTTLEYILDMAAALADNLPDDAFAMLKRPSTRPDPRLDLVLGPSTARAEDSWLAIASSGVAPATGSLGTGSNKPTAAARGRSQDSIHGDNFSTSTPQSILGVDASAFTDVSFGAESDDAFLSTPIPAPEPGLGSGFGSAPSSAPSSPPSQSQTQVRPLPASLARQSSSSNSGQGQASRKPSTGGFPLPPKLPTTRSDLPKDLPRKPDWMSHTPGSASERRLPPLQWKQNQQSTRSRPFEAQGQGLGQTSAQRPPGPIPSDSFQRQDGTSTSVPSQPRSQPQLQRQDSSNGPAPTSIPANATATAIATSDASPGTGQESSLVSNGSGASTPNAGRARDTVSNGGHSIEPRLYPYQVKWWELIPDAAPHRGGNDTGISLSLFGARRV